VNPWVAVIIAIVGGGGPIVALIARLDRKNDKQHGDNAAMLSRIETKVDTVGERVAGHLEWHLKDPKK
jgi:uncharacterized membrane-anchored protein YhcB (DUF1043 family)